MTIKEKIGNVIKIPLVILKKFSIVGKESAESYQHIAKTKFVNCIYTTDYFIRIIKADLTKDNNWFIPKDINKRFRLGKTYIDGKGERWVLVNNNNPKSLDLDKPLEDYKGTKRIYKQGLDKDGNSIQSIDLQAYVVKGGDIVSSVAYDVGNFPFMNIFKIATRNEIIYLLVIGSFIGFFIHSFIVGKLI
jgi:hypothetical protein